jgi:hypothetical protein
LAYLSDEDVFRDQILACHRSCKDGLSILEAFGSPLGPQTRQSTDSRSGRDLYSLVPSQPRAEFESAIQSWALVPDGRIGIPCNGDDGYDFLACVALALTDWDSYESKPWQPHDDLQTVTEQLGLLLEATLKHYAGDTEDIATWGREDFIRLRCLIRDFTTGILEKGLYLLPSENPVSRLFQLREKGAVVYML